MPLPLKSTNPDRPWLWAILLVMTITAAVFYWSTTGHHQPSRTAATRIDPQGHLHVLGITLGSTTLRQAETILKSRSDIALYIYPLGHPRAGLKLEAFFPAIADHSKVILLLSVDRQRLTAIQTRATMPHLYPDKVARMNLAPSDQPKIYNATVSELTLIPSLQLTANDLKLRFGQPDTMKSLPGQGQQLGYSRFGLQATLHKQEPSILHFSNPGSGKAISNSR